MEFSELLASLGSVLVTSLAFFLRNTISLSVYAYQTHPQATSIVFAVIGAFLLYKVVIRIIRMWINIFITALKTIFVLATIVVLFVIYLRGWNRLVNADIPYLWKLIKSLKDSGAESEKSPLWFLTTVLTSSNTEQLLERLKDGFSNAGDTASSILEDYDVDFDVDPSAYFEYMNKNFKKNKEDFNYEKIQQIVSDGFESAEEYLKSSGVDLNDIGNNILKNILNNNNGGRR
ncbi:uncharacterized protein RJT20DRAFT_64246 [Scheffersomyces xylosifermentans]|uniref:uncharacterized protein n=1 Tax=Scheffersomyces xylosifermentans TaxID=1304137 RepID=UPI00315D79DA